MNPIYCKLSSNQLQMLSIFLGYKSFARKKYWEEFQEKMNRKENTVIPTFETIVDELVELKVIRKSKNGALSLTLDRTQVCMLYDLNVKSTDEIIKMRDSYEVHVRDQTVLVENMRKSGKYNVWPESMRLDSEVKQLQNTRETYEYYRTLVTYSFVANSSQKNG